MQGGKQHKLFPVSHRLIFYKKFQLSQNVELLTFNDLFFRAGSMSRDASSSATTNRSYLRQQKIANETLKKLELTDK